VNSLLRKVIEQRRGAWLPAAFVMVMAVALPFESVTAQAEDADGVKAKAAPPAEDPAEVQRRQQIKHQAAHWEQQFTKLLYGDLELMRSLCGDLPRESRRAIARTGEQMAKEAAMQLAELQFGGRQRQQQINVKEGKRRIVFEVTEDDAGKTAENPVSLVSEALRKSLAEHAGDEKARAFAREIGARNDRRTAAMVHEIVAMLDAELFLTARQREEIEEALLEKWEDRMGGALHGMHMVNGRRVFPELPDECIRPHLTEPQREQFVAAPQNFGAARAWHAQAWMRTMNLLNNVQPADRDPWWFE
jgi:hypothetical protein